MSKPTAPPQATGGAAWVPAPHTRGLGCPPTGLLHSCVPVPSRGLKRPHSSRSLLPSRDRPTTSIPWEVLIQKERGPWRVGDPAGILVRKVRGPTQTGAGSPAAATVQDNCGAPTLSPRRSLLQEVSLQGSPGSVAFTRNSDHTLWGLLGFFKELLILCRWQVETCLQYKKQEMSHFFILLKAE